MKDDILEKLKAIFDIKQDIRDNKNRIERWRSLAERVSPVLSDMPKSNNLTDRVSECCIEIATLEEENNRLAAELLEKQIANQRLIDSKLTGEMADIMSKRYVECLSWGKVEYQTNKTYKRLMHCHRQALDKLAE